MPCWIKIWFESFLFELQSLNFQNIALHYLYNIVTHWFISRELIHEISNLLQNICTNKENSSYRGPLNGTIHVVAGGGGASLSDFTTIKTKWSIYKDYDFGFVKLTAFDHSNLLFEYKKSSDGKVYDTFRISRDYRDILACTVDSCPATTLASWYGPCKIIFL